MIYEHHAREGRFYIEWDRARAWGAENETKWICTHKGLTLARGARPDAVLDAVLSGKVESAPRGLDMADIWLPASLAEWRNSRD